MTRSAGGVDAFYVYAHRSPDGQIFYVGKGRGARAWSVERHPVWTHYVNTRLGGKFDVEILHEGLSEDHALDLEGELIFEFGEGLVNWVNPRRQFDDQALERYHHLRDTTKTFVSETRQFEALDFEMAIARYREALARVDEYTMLEPQLEHGLVADLCREMGGPSGDVHALDRLTLVLRRAGRYQDIVDEVDVYFAKYPASVTGSHAVHKRREEARAILAGERRAPGSAAAPRRSRRGTVDELELTPLLERARDSGMPHDWMVAAKCCRKAADIDREALVLGEFLSGPRVTGRAWLKLEERFHTVRARIASARPHQAEERAE